MSKGKKIPTQANGKAFGTTASTMGSWKDRTFSHNKGGSGKPRGKAKIKILYPPKGGWPHNTEPYVR